MIFVETTYMGVSKV